MSGLIRFARWLAVDRRWYFAVVLGTCGLGMAVPFIVEAVRQRNAKTVVLSGIFTAATIGELVMVQLAPRDPVTGKVSAGPLPGAFIFVTLICACVFLWQLRRESRSQPGGASGAEGSVAVAGLPPAVPADPALPSSTDAVVESVEDPGRPRTDSPPAAAIRSTWAWIGRAGVWLLTLAFLVMVVGTVAMTVKGGKPASTIVTAWLCMVLPFVALVGAVVWDVRRLWKTRPA